MAYTNINNTKLLIFGDHREFTSRRAKLQKAGKPFCNILLGKR